MSSDSQTRATELLQELGLKEYESKCLVALTRMSEGTAKEISSVTDVPRTRVYDAIRVLEAKGLVQVQHTSPRRYRAVSIEEATELLEREYHSRISTLEETLDGLPPTKEGEEPADVGEIWGITNHEAITTRFLRLIENATSEIILVVSEPACLDEEVYDALDAASNRGVEVIIGVVNDDLAQEFRERAPATDVFVSDVPWLPRVTNSHGSVITRVLLVDENTIVVGSRPATNGVEEAEQAVVGSGTANGIVTILRHLLRTGLLEGRGGG